MKQKALAKRRAPQSCIEPKDFAQWAENLRQMCEAFNASPWAIGDSINYAEKRWLSTKEGKAQYGIKYRAAVEITRLDIETLRAMSWVSNSVEPSRRRYGLSWSHHHVVAGLDAEQQEKFLALAVENGWKRGDLREAIRAENKTTIDEPNIGIGFVAQKWINEGLRGIRKEVGRLGPIETWSNSIRESWKRDLKPLVDIYAQL